MSSPAQRDCVNCAGRQATEVNEVALGSAYAKNQQKDMDAAEKKILKAAVEQFFDE